MYIYIPIDSSRLQEYSADFIGSEGIVKKEICPFVTQGLDCIVTKPRICGVWKKNQ